MFWQSPYSKPVEGRAEGEVREVLPSDVLRQVLYPAAGLCMVVTMYAVAFYHSRMEQPTYYPSETSLPAVAASHFGDPETGAARGVVTGTAGLANDCPLPKPATEVEGVTGTRSAAGSDRGADASVQDDPR